MARPAANHDAHAAPQVRDTRQIPHPLISAHCPCRRLPACTVLHCPAYTGSPRRVGGHLLAGFRKTGPSGPGSTNTSARTRVCVPDSVSGGARRAQTAPPSRPSRRLLRTATVRLSTAHVWRARSPSRASVGEKPARPVWPGQGEQSRWLIGRHPSSARRRRLPNYRRPMRTRTRTATAWRCSTSHILHLLSCHCIITCDLSA